MDKNIMKKKIRIAIFDVDGTLTDGKIYMGNNGEVFKAFDIKDGYALGTMLPHNNVVPVIITARNSRIVENRCRELKINHLYQGCHNKVETMRKVADLFEIACNEEGIYEEVAYFGDDVIDIPCMKMSGISGSPADAVKEVVDIVDFISAKRGGSGAAREFVEWLIK